MAPPTDSPHTMLKPLHLIGQHAMVPQSVVVPPLQRRGVSPLEAAALTASHVAVAETEAAEGGGKRKRGRPSRKPLVTDARSLAGEAAKPTRKYVYVAQKEERDELMEQVRALEEHVERLRFEAGLPTRADTQQITRTWTRNAEIDEKIHSNRRLVTQLQARVNEELLVPTLNPLASRVRLPGDMDARREILRGLKDVKLRRAAEIGIERFQHLDATLPYMSEERFTTEDGVFHCNRWEMVAFPQFETARQMYDALLFFICNMEISVTEMANQVAVREDDQDIEPTIWNHRIVTTTEDVGCVEELNLVGFAQFYERCDLVDGAPLGVIVMDTVEQDDLYPYKPEERTRKDVQTFHLFCEVVDPATQGKAVVLKTCLLNAQLPAQFPLDASVTEKLHKYMSRWVVLMNQYLSEYTVRSRAET